MQVPSPIPEGLVASVYVSMYPYATWRCLGAVSNAEPSKILNVQWPEADVQDQACPPPPLTAFSPTARSLLAHALLQTPFALTGPTASACRQPPEAPCQIGVTIEAAGAAVAVGEAQVALQEEFGKKIGMDLMTFMESFNHGVVRAAHAP